MTGRTPFRTLVALTLLVAALGACRTDVDDETAAAAFACPEGHVPKGSEALGLLWCEEDGMPAGPWLSLHTDGAPASEGTYVNGLRSEPTASYWPAGNPAARVEGETLTVYDEGGKPVGTAPFRDGRLVSCPPGATPRRDGRTSSCVVGTDGAERRVGIQRTYYPDGSLESEQGFVDGKPHGTFRSWHPNGSPWMTGEFVAGKRHGPWYAWGADGRPVDRARGVPRFPRAHVAAASAE